MLQPGVEIRPLREMTGRAMFNEVFIDNARVRDEDMIGGLNNGWAVANTTLMAERTGLGTGGSGAVGSAFAGPIAKQLDDRVGDHVGQVRTGGTGGGGRSAAQSLARLAKELGKNEDPVIRQKLAKLYTLQELGRMSALRMKSRRRLTGGEPNIAKLMMSDLLRLQRDVGNEIVGAYGMVRVRTRPAAAWCRSSRCSRPARRSTAAPTRCSATSSASGCSASRRNRDRPRTRPSTSCSSTSNPCARGLCA